MLPIVIRLSQASKMPCPSYSLPAEACKTGSRLHKIKGSVCEKCYARKNFYRMPPVRAPRDWNLQVWNERSKSIAGRDAWIAEMVRVIAKSKASFFRWFDSGDIQSIKMLQSFPV